MVNEETLLKLDKAIRKIELNLSECLRQKLSWDEVQRKLDENFEIASENGLTFEKIRWLYSRIYAKYRESFKRKVSRGALKVSGEFYLPIVDVLFGGKEYSLRILFKDLASQIVFCFCVRSLLLYLKQNQIWEKDIQTLVDRYNSYKFEKDDVVPLTLPWGQNTTRKMGYVLLIEWQRLSKGWRDYLLHKTELREWKYDHHHMNDKGELKSVLTKVPAFGNIRASRMATITNLDYAPEEWNWSCECKDFRVYHHRKILLMCHHISAIVWKLMDEGYIKKPWDSR